MLDIARYLAGPKYKVLVISAQYHRMLSKKGGKRFERQRSPAQITSIMRNLRRRGTFRSAHGNSAPSWLLAEVAFERGGISRAEASPAGGECVTGRTSTSVSPSCVSVPRMHWRRPHAARQH